MDTMKAELRIKFVVLHSYCKLERSHANNLRAHLKALEPKKVIIPKSNAQQHVIILRTEINKIETKRTSKRIN